MPPVIWRVVAVPVVQSHLSTTWVTSDDPDPEPSGSTPLKAPGRGHQFTVAGARRALDLPHGGAGCHSSTLSHQESFLHLCS